MRVLSGDIGGTKTRLAVIAVNGNSTNIELERNYSSGDYGIFEDMLENFLQGIDRPKRATFGIAGPVNGRVAKTTNLPWLIDSNAISKRFALDNCTLINDLEATAYGLPALGANDLMILHKGTRHDPSGNAAVIAAGTGLGEAGLFWDGKAFCPFATEGGHASFSPGNELEVELLKHLQQSHAHVSWERIVSGPGLVCLHEFLCHYRNKPVPADLHKSMKQGDPAAVISEAALDGKDALCVEALEWFVRLYGAEAGNLALKVMSRAGIYLGGGIAPKILPFLKSGSFLEAFFNKGRMRPLLEAMPIKVILNDRAALLGSALHAAQS